MRWFYKWRRRLATFFKRSNTDDELALEIEQHVDMVAAEYEADGLAPDIARKKALREFGNVEALKEECRDNWGTQMLTGSLKEFRLGLRLLWKNKGFTSAVVITLAICMGGNAIAFTILHSVLSPPPIPDSNRLVQIYEVFPGRDGFSKHLGGGSNSSAFMEFTEFADTLELVSLVQLREVNVSLDESTTRDRMLWITKPFFDLVPISPILGRHFIAQDFYAVMEVKHDSVFPVILAESFWRNQLGGDPDVIGKIIQVDSIRNRIVGVVPNETGSIFGRPQLYRPWRQPHEITDAQRLRSRLGVIANGGLWGRLKEGVTIEQAKAQIDVINQRLFERMIPGKQELRKRNQQETLLATSQAIIHSQMGKSLYLLQTSVLVVLIIACLNVANLMIARGMIRRAEYAVRGALGASRRLLFRQILMECLALALASFLIGILIAWPGLTAVNNYLLPDILTTAQTESLFWGTPGILFFGSFVPGRRLSFNLLFSLIFDHWKPESASFNQRRELQINFE